MKMTTKINEKKGVKKMTTMTMGQLLNVISEQVEGGFYYVTMLDGTEYYVMGMDVTTFAGGGWVKIWDYATGNHVVALSEIALIEFADMGPKLVKIA